MPRLARHGSGCPVRHTDYGLGVVISGTRDDTYLLVRFDFGVKGVCSVLVRDQFPPGPAEEIPPSMTYKGYRLTARVRHQDGSWVGEVLVGRDQVVYWVDVSQKASRGEAVEACFIAGRGAVDSDWTLTESDAPEPGGIRSQREMMRYLASQYGRNEELVCEAYARAELRGNVQRRSNMHHLSPKEYAHRLFEDGQEKGWF